jgi:hypothetical protein
LGVKIAESKEEKEYKQQYDGAKLGFDMAKSKEKTAIEVKANPIAITLHSLTNIKGKCVIDCKLECKNDFSINRSLYWYLWETYCYSKQYS